MATLAFNELKNAFNIWKKPLDNDNTKQKEIISTNNGIQSVTEIYVMF